MAKVKKKLTTAQKRARKKTKEENKKKYLMGIPKWKASKNQKTAHDRRH
jgi:hypothetical protein